MGITGYCDMQVAHVNIYHSHHNLLYYTKQYDILILSPYLMYYEPTVNLYHIPCNFNWVSYITWCTVIDECVPGDEFCKEIHLYVQSYLTEMSPCI